MTGRTFPIVSGTQGYSMAKAQNVGPQQRMIDLKLILIQVHGKQDSEIELSKGLARGLRALEQAAADGDEDVTVVMR